MAALAGGWITCAAVAAVAGVVAVGSFALREASRPRPSAAPAVAAAALASAPKPAAASGSRATAQVKPAQVKAAEVKAPQVKAPQVKAPQVKPAEAAPPALVFDVVRVEPGGAAVVAGHGPPSIQVALLDGDRVVERVDSDASGQFVFMPPSLSSGAHVLRLAPAGGAPGNGVHVEVPSAPGRPPTVAAATPTERAASPAPAATPAAPAVSFRTLQAEPGGAFVVTGSGPPGHVIRVSVDGVFVVAVRPQADGSWSLRVEQGVSAGRYALHADDVNEADGKVLASADTSFEYAGGAAAEASPAARTPAETPGARPAERSAAAGPQPVEAIAPPAASGSNQVGATEVPPLDGQPAPGTTPAATPESRPASAAAVSASPVPVRKTAPAPRPGGTAVAGMQPTPRVGASAVRLAHARMMSLPARRPLPGRSASATTVKRNGYAAAPAHQRASAPPRTVGRAVPVARVRRHGPAYARASIRYGQLRPAAARLPLFRPARRIAIAHWRTFVRSTRPVPRGSAPAYGATRTVVVRPGDTLSNISERAYGPGWAQNFARVVQANAASVRDPQLIVAGQTLVLPPAPLVGGAPR